MSRNSQSRFKRHSKVESAPLEDECILYHPGDNRFLRLNQTASFIWGRIEQPATAEEIAGALLEQFQGVERQDAVRDVSTALEHMVSMTLGEALPASDHETQNQGGDR